MSKTKRMKNGYIVPDTRLPLEFHLILIRGGVEVKRRVSTRAETIREGFDLVSAVGASIVKEDQWDDHRVEMIN